jgi:hypothetical protein
MFFRKAYLLVFCIFFSWMIMGMEKRIVTITNEPWSPSEDKKHILKFNQLKNEIIENGMAQQGYEAISDKYPSEEILKNGNEKNNEITCKGKNLWLGLRKRMVSQPRGPLISPTLTIHKELIKCPVFFINSNQTSLFKIIKNFEAQDEKALLRMLNIKFAGESDSSDYNAPYDWETYNAPYGRETLHEYRLFTNEIIKCGNDAVTLKHLLSRQNDANKKDKKFTIKLLLQPPTKLLQYQRNKSFIDTLFVQNTD